MALYWGWGEGLRAFWMLWSHVSRAVGEGGCELQRPEHLQQAHVKTSFHVSISPYEMWTSSAVWISLVALRATPCRSRHSPVSFSTKTIIGAISAFVHWRQHEWFAYCPRPGAGGVAVRSVLSWLEGEDRLIRGWSFGGIQYAPSVSTTYWSLSWCGSLFIFCLRAVKVL